MKLEQPSIESTIKEIKKAEAEKEVESAVEGFETEAVAEAVEDEIPAGIEDKDELEKTAKTEALAEEMELNPEAKERKEAREKIIEYSKEIYKIGKDYEMVYSHFEPAGADGKREFNEEMDLFLKSREKGENYQPVFTYPEMDKQSIDDLQKKYQIWRL